MESWHGACFAAWTGPWQAEPASAARIAALVPVALASVARTAALVPVVLASVARIAALVPVVLASVARIAAAILPAAAASSLSWERSAAFAASYSVQ